MSEQDTRDETARRITTGFQWEAIVFLALWRELRSRYGPDTVQEIASRAMREAGLVMGRQAATEIQTRGPRGVAEAWDLIYGSSPDCVLELTDDRFVYRGNGCPAYWLWVKMGLEPSEISEMADAYCAVDYGFAQAFGADVHCVHTARLMKGNSFCEWVHTRTDAVQPLTAD
jgi:hypothetical protein